MLKRANQKAGETARDRLAQKHWFEQNIVREAMTIGDDPNYYKPSPPLQLPQHPLVYLHPEVERKLRDDEKQRCATYGPKT